MKTKIAGLILMLWMIHGTAFAQDSTSFHVHLKSQLHLDAGKAHLFNDYQIQPGEKLVFEYAWNAREPGNQSNCPEVIVWEVGAKAKSFSFTDADFEQSQAHYGQLCQNVDRGFHALTAGTLSGERQKDGTWKVRMRVDAEGRSGKEYHFELEEVFYEK